MASVNYIYSVSADTLNGRVNPITLSDEIRSSTITIALDFINVTGDVLNIWFKATLSGAEIIELTAVVNNHIGEMGVTDPPDTIIAQLTLEGRNLLARAKLGDIVYRQLGWQLGRGGYIQDRPVKLTPFIDTASEAIGYFDLVDNSSWSLGTYISLNGKQFIYGTHFFEGITPDVTITNIKNAILDSRDSRHYRLVEPIIDVGFPNRLYIQSLCTGETGNTYPLLAYHVGMTTNFLTTPMSSGTSTFLEDPAYPTPTVIAPYIGSDGFIEQPASTSISFLSRIGDGISGIGAYGELGLWVEILDSNYTSEIGNRVLFAMAHFPIQPKTDRTILTFRVVVSF